MVLLLGVAALPLEVSAQHPSGHVSAFVDYMPDREHTTELRLHTKQREVRWADQQNLHAFGLVDLREVGVDRVDP